VEQKGRGGEEKSKKHRVNVWHGKQEMPVARARLYPERENTVVLPLQPLEIWARAKRAGFGRVRSRNMFGYVLIAVSQYRQRRDAAAAGEEQLGRYSAEQSKYNCFICTVAS
jgi:hypothetical protein